MDNSRSDPFDGEPGPRFRGARRAAKKGVFAHGLAMLMYTGGLTLDDLLEHSSPDGDNYSDKKFLKKILDVDAFPDADTFVNIIDALIETWGPVVLARDATDVRLPRGVDRVGHALSLYERTGFGNPPPGSQ